MLRHAFRTFLRRIRSLQLLPLLCAVGLAVSVAVCPAAPAHAQDKPMRMAYPEYWPFHSRNEQGVMQGVFHDILQQALGQELGISLEWRAFPWSRCQLNVRKGVDDAMVTVPTRERLKYAVTHSRPFYIKKMKIFTRVDHPRMPVIESVHDLEDVRRAHLTVITYADNGWNNVNVVARGISTETTPNLVNVWRMLEHGRGDIVIEWPGAAWPDIHAAGLQDRVVETDVELATMPFHLLVGKKSGYAWVVDRLDAVIDRMNQDGSIARILSRYEGVGGPEGDE